MQEQVERREAIRQVLKEPEPARQRTRRGCQTLTHQVHLTNELGDSRRGARPGRCPAQHAFFDQPEVVAKRLEGVGVHQRRGRAQFAQCLAGDQAAPHEVPAVHRGDVHRVQGRQRRRVDPVVEMSAVLRRPRDRPDRPLEAVDQIRHREVAEIAGRDRRQQLEPDVGRRCAGHDRIFPVGLIVVRDEPVVLGRDQLVEVAPRLARDAAQPLPVGRVEADIGPSARHSRAVRDGRRQSPEHQQRQGADQSSRMPAQHDRPENDRQRRRDPELAPRRCGVVVEASSGIRRRFPLEEVLPADRHPPQRAEDGVGHHPGLMRQEGGRQQGLPHAGRQVGLLAAEVLAQRHTSQTAVERLAEAQVGGVAQDEQAQQGPGERRSRQHRPSQREQRHQGRRQHAPTQVVQNLPPRQDGQRVAHPSAVGRDDCTAEPTGNLPVAAHPAVESCGPGEVVAREVVHQVDVGHQTRPREESFEQVVAEQRVVAHASGQRDVERARVVDAFADVTAFVEQVLIDVRRGGRVRIPAHVPGHHVGKPRPRRAGQADLDARLEYAVAFGHPADHGIEARTIQGMRDGADEAAGAVGRQLRVGVERDNVPTPRDHTDVADLHVKRRVVMAQHQPVELFDLAALALPSHPSPGGRIQPPLTMQE